MDGGSSLSSFRLVAPSGCGRRRAMAAGQRAGEPRGLCLCSSTVTAGAVQAARLWQRQVHHWHEELTGRWTGQLHQHARHLTQARAWFMPAPAAQQAAASRSAMERSLIVICWCLSKGGGFLSGPAGARLRSAAQTARQIE